MPSFFEKLFKTKPTGSAPSATQAPPATPPPNPFDTLFAQATAAAAAHDLPRALSLYDQAIAAAPTDRKSVV